jgi:hypothetical protein
MSNLGSTYAMLGRYQDSLRVAQEAFEFMQRVLPPDDPQKSSFSEVCMCVTFV